jgi:ketosteroid isomerase-like protein
VHLVTITDLHPAMAGHLEAVTQDAERLRALWAPGGVLEFPYATPEMTSRIEGVDALVAYFGGPRRWEGWQFEPGRAVVDPERRLHVAEIHATARWIETGRPYVQDYVIWMTLDADDRIVSWREYWDKARV